MAAPRKAYALAALLAGASAIGTSALFVKVSETGPVATAFWRAALALPVLWLWAWRTDRGARQAGATALRPQAIAWAGALFAGDLAFWHGSIIITSVANATLLANLAPIFVTLAAWFWYRNRPTPRFLAGMAIALGGMVCLLGGDFLVRGDIWIGDVLGLITAMFYAAYQMTVSRLRERASTARIMAWASTVTAILLVPVMLLLGERCLPVTVYGWMKLVALALIAQVAGQSLIAYALAHLATSFASVGLLLQPVVAALLAWVLLGEKLSAAQFVGAALILAGIALARHAAHRARG